MTEEQEKPNRYEFGIAALEHIYKLLFEAGEINGEQARELTELVIKETLDGNASCTLQEK